MRRLRASLLVILAAACAMANGALDAGATAACGHRLCLDARLPAPLTITTTHTRFLIARDGRIRRTPAPQVEPPGSIVFPATGTWYMIRHDHLVVGRGLRPLWRSHQRIASARQVGVVMASRRSVAFQHDHRLWLARGGGAEHAVAQRELPLGWTRGGLYTYRYPSRQLLLHGPGGRVLKVIAHRPLGSDYFVANGRLDFIGDGSLMSAFGARVRRLAPLAGLGMSADSWLQPVGRLLELEDIRRLVVVRPDGSPFASMLLRGRNISSGLVADTRGTAVAFTSVGRGSAADGPETTYVLRAGARASAAVHTEQVSFRVCERGARLQWHGTWLLYTNSEGNIVMVDTVGRHRAIDLTAPVTSLPGTRDGFAATWTGRTG